MGDRALPREASTALACPPQTLPTQHPIFSPSGGDLPSGFETSVPKNKVTIVPSKIVSKRYPCPISQCAKEYSREDRLRAHLRSSLDSPHQTYWADLNDTVCAECGKTLADPAGLKRHENFSHGRRPDKNKKERKKGTKKKARNATPMTLSSGNVFVAANTTGGDLDFGSLNAERLRKYHHQPLNSEVGVSMFKELQQPLTASDEGMIPADQPDWMTGYRLATTSPIPRERRQWCAVGDALPWEGGHWPVRSSSPAATDPIPGEEQWSEAECSLNWETHHWPAPAESGALPWETDHWPAAIHSSLSVADRDVGQNELSMAGGSLPWEMVHWNAATGPLPTVTVPDTWAERESTMEKITEERSTGLDWTNRSLCQLP